MAASAAIFFIAIDSCDFLIQHLYARPGRLLLAPLGGIFA